MYLFISASLPNVHQRLSTLMCVSLFGYHSTDVLLLICGGLHGKLGHR
ncbi:hypothetical protein yrohd0001_23460 [Yersinia rohdei ATCC 43380]|nr:hypothetical protein yrohd0001_23460 [Yersinia rohdei ATCC 43380]